MGYSNLPILATGDWIDAAYGNQYWGDNFRALWPYAAAGDLAYATGASANLARLAKPSLDSLLKNTNAGVPSWLAIAGIPGVLHAQATVDFNAGDQVISSATFVDITNATVDIVTTRTCTIRMIAVGTFAAGGGGQRTLVQGVISGTGSGDTVHTSMTVYVPYTVVYYRTGVGGGTRNCKLQGRGNGAGNSGIFHQGRIVVEAFVE